MSYAKVYIYKKQRSADSGATWQDVEPEEYVLKTYNDLSAVLGEEMVYSRIQECIDNFTELFIFNEFHETIQHPI